MIDQTLTFIRDQINDYLEETIQSKKAVLGHVVNLSGQTNVSEIGLTLINIEEEPALKNKSHYRRISDDETARYHPPVHLNLFLLVSAYFGDTEEHYREALKNLARVVSFFQAKPVFNQHNSEGLDPAIEKVITEMVTLGFEQQSNLWSALGGKYLPSVIYKIRPVAVARDNTISSGPPITEIIINPENDEED